MIAAHRYYVARTPPRFETETGTYQAEQKIVIIDIDDRTDVDMRQSFQTALDSRLPERDKQDVRDILWPCGHKKADPKTKSI